MAVAIGLRLFFTFPLIFTYSLSSTINNNNPTDLRRVTNWEELQQPGYTYKDLCRVTHLTIAAVKSGLDG